MHRLNSQSPVGSWLSGLAHLIDSGGDVNAAIESVVQHYSLDDGSDIRLKAHIKSLLKEAFAAADIAPRPEGAKAFH
jgi:hypothetical protein